MRLDKLFSELGLLSRRDCARAAKQGEILEETPAETSVQAPAQKGMAIVLASATSLSNAENYANDLQARGYDACVYQKDKMVRVIIPCYDGEENARRKLNQMKQSGKEFKQAWITSLE